MNNTFTKNWPDLFYGQASSQRLKEFTSWLRDHGNDFVTLFHGTDASLPIMEKGLLPTSPNRRRSLQSNNGYVCLSVFPAMARTFGEMGNPMKKIIVYGVMLCVKRLKPDLDQLNNQRAFAGRDLAPTLANSLIYGHGARVKGKIDPFQLTPNGDER